MYFHFSCEIPSFKENLFVWYRASQLETSSDTSHQEEGKKLERDDATLIPSGKKTHKGIEMKKPKSVLDYNVAKKGIDLSDQMSSYNLALKKNQQMVATRKLQWSCNHIFHPNAGE